MPQADDHGPAGVMGDHTHHKGTFMVSYEYMNMISEGLQSGTSGLSNAEFFANTSYTTAPQRMDMEMHMLGFMKAPSETLTLMLMLPYKQNRMRSVMANDSEMNMRTEGLGDVQLTALLSLGSKQKEDHTDYSHVNLGLSIPTGEIDEESNNMTAGYAMQLGSGTYDLIGEYVRKYDYDMASIGFQSSGTLRLGKNSEDYKLGHKYHITTWASTSWSRRLSSSIRLQYKYEGQVDGSHADITMMTNPTLDPANTGGQSITLGLGSNYLLGKSKDSARLSIEYIYPLRQHFNGIQTQQTGTWLATIQI